MSVFARVCRWCHGTGSYPSLGNRCTACNGTGHERPDQ